MSQANKRVELRCMEKINSFLSNRKVAETGFPHYPSSSDPHWRSLSRFDPLPSEPKRADRMSHELERVNSSSRAGPLSSGCQRSEVVGLRHKGRGVVEPLIFSSLTGRLSLEAPLVGPRNPQEGAS